MELSEIVAVSAVRTPMGKYGRSLRDVPVYRLGAVVVQEALARCGGEPAQVGEVLLGCCRQAGNGTNPARTAARLAGCPGDVPATTVTMACAAGMRSVIMGAQMLMANDSELLVTGGMESMSTIPYLLVGARWEGLGSGHQLLYDGWWDSRDPFTELGTGEVTEDLVEKYKISREEQDQFAYESHMKAARAQDGGHFDEEVVPVRWTTGDGEEVRLERDESIRRDTSLEKLANLKPPFRPDGTLTAGNSSGLTDGAAAIVLTTREQAKAIGAEPLFSILSYSVGAADNQYMGEGPSVVMPIALKKAGMTMDDLDLLEVNEAFAGMVLANQQQLGWDPETLNVHGGAIALGHPVGCSGARILVTLYHALKTYDKEFGGATVGAAGGVATAMIIRRES